MYRNKFSIINMFRQVSNEMFNNNFKHILSVSKIASQPEPARMEKTLNNVTLLGRVGSEPQRKGKEEHPVVIFSMATHSNYRYETGEFMQRVEWHRVCVFKPALRDAVYNFMKKGQRVLVNGRLTYGEIKGEDGKPRTTTAIVADDVIFFQSPESNTK